MTMQFDQSQFRAEIKALPNTPHPDMSERYSFFDTKKVVDNMFDLGFQIFDFRRPATRTADGQFGLHEIDFRRPEDMGRGNSSPRVLFYNTYDGTRRAQFLSGVFRFACSNGLVIGETAYSEKFLHMNTSEDDFLENLEDAVRGADEGIRHTEKFQTITLDPSQYREMAREAVALRFDGSKTSLEIDPAVALSPRRREDLKTDLWTQWNVLQENLVGGGLPGITSDGKTKIARPVGQIQKSVKLNRDLWDLLETTAEAA